VEDGHTLHLVVRQPGQSATSGNAGNEGTTSNPARRRGPTMTRSIVLEAINVGQGSELSVAQVFLVPMHLYIFSYCVPLVDI
jgi:hypothetical protein